MTSLCMMAIGERMQNCEVAIRRLLGGWGRTTNNIDSSGTEYLV